MHHHLLLLPTTHKGKDVIDLLDATNAQLRIHGNGFMQAQLPNPKFKMHLWFEDCPRQRVATPLHNHNHAFRSWILWGTLRNIEYKPRPGTEFMPHKAIPRKGKDTRLEPENNLPIGMARYRDFTFGQGSRYEWPLDENLYHVSRSNTNWCLTIVERLEKADWEPTVMVPTAMEPDNDFDRYNFYDEAKKAYEYAATLLDNTNIPPQLVNALDIL